MATSSESTTPLFLFKYGGNAMVDPDLQVAVLQGICTLKERGYRIVIVHGGGPYIQEALDMAKIESEFIGGHRKTSLEALRHVEMALKGNVNGRLVSIINRLGHKAVGLSGKDGKCVIARKRFHNTVENGRDLQVDLGQVGDVASIDTGLIDTLLDSGYLPVMTCIASDDEGNDYNINADMFAGHMAGALNADEYLVLTDVDGLLEDPGDASSLIRYLEVSKIGELRERGVISGGMIPKMESCRVALERGARSARILNGTKPEVIAGLLDDPATGTFIKSIA